MIIDSLMCFELHDVGMESSKRRSVLMSLIFIHKEFTNVELAKKAQLKYFVGFQAGAS